MLKSFNSTQLLGTKLTLCQHSTFEVVLLITHHCCVSFAEFHLISVKLTSITKSSHYVAAIYIQLDLKTFVIVSIFSLHLQVVMIHSLWN